MKTAGYFLRAARLEKGLNQDQLSSLTKIDTKYIEAIESDDYSRLPSETFTKGFIRNLSTRLDLNPDEMVAVFRRDYKTPRSIEVKTTPKIKGQTFKSANTSPIILGVVFGVVFIGYLIFQFRAIITPPNLQIVRPSNKAVLSSPVEIEGITDVDSRIQIGSDLQVKPDISGHFIGRLTLPIGDADVEIKSTNRFSRSTLKKIHLTIVTQ